MRISEFNMGSAGYVSLVPHNNHNVPRLNTLWIRCVSFSSQDNGKDAELGSRHIVDKE